MKWDCSEPMREFLAKLLRGLLKRGAEVAIVDGLWIGADDPPQLTKVLEALRLIEAADPRRYLRLTKDLTGIWVTLLADASAQFYYLEFMCELDQRYVARSSVDSIASAIVHEATHARLWRRFGYAEEVRQRVEKICVTQEAAFRVRLAEPSETEDPLRDFDALPADTWSDETFARRHHRGRIAALRHLKTPNWLIMLLLRRHRAAAMRRRLQLRTSKARVGMDKKNPPG